VGFREVGVVEVREALRGWLKGAGLRWVAERAEQCLKPVDGVGKGVPSRVSSEGQVKRGSR